MLVRGCGNMALEKYCATTSDAASCCGPYSVDSEDLRGIVRILAPSQSDHARIHRERAVSYRPGGTVRTVAGRHKYTTNSSKGAKTERKFLM